MQKSYHYDSLLTGKLIIQRKASRDNSFIGLIIEVGAFFSGNFQQDPSLFWAINDPMDGGLWGWLDVTE